MKKWFVKILFPIISSIVIDQIKNNVSKDKVIAAINSKVDLPKLSEAQEAALFGVIYDILISSINIGGK